MVVVKANLGRDNGKFTAAGMKMVVKDRVHDRFRAKVGKDIELLEEVDDNEKMGPWVQTTNEHIGRSYYYNRETRATVWKMPPSIKFYLPKTLTKIMKQKFSKAEFGEIKQQFTDFDLDDSGEIDPLEMRLVIDALGASTSKEDALKLFDELDMDGSGKVAFDEFALMILSIEKKGGKTFGFSKIRSQAQDKDRDFYNDMRRQHAQNNHEQSLLDGGGKQAKAKKHVKGYEGPTGVFWEGRVLEGKTKKEDGVVYVMEDGKWRRKATGVCTIA
jgi:hypothetical protein